MAVCLASHMCLQALAVCVCVCVPGEAHVFHHPCQAQTHTHTHLLELPGPRRGSSGLLSELNLYQALRDLNSLEALRRGWRCVSVLLLLLQVLEHGCFNCDPHPGNLMLMPDGRLALIDFGQVCLWSSVCLW